LVVGSEAHGLPAHIVETCDALISIEMPGGVESLNAAVAASIAMYAMTALDGSSFPDTMRP
ncbi:MAG: TrmH family RNA methyltransferase, partial [Actinomycetota bacterium]